MRRWTKILLTMSSVGVLLLQTQFLYAKECKPGRERDLELCYPICESNYKGVGPVCWEHCPNGFSDDGALCRKNAHIFAKPSYGRGVGVVPRECGAGQEYEAGLCYTRCREGYRGRVTACYGTCPAGYRDDGLTCHQDAHITRSDNSQCPWYDKCGLTLKRGCSKCPAGYSNDGCTCRRNPHTVGKPSYGRGVGVVPRECGASKEYDAGLCYDRCKSGYTGRGPVCWGTCPTEYKDDSATCRKDVIILAKKSYGRGVGIPPCDYTKD